MIPNTVPSGVVLVISTAFGVAALVLFILALFGGSIAGERDNRRVAVLSVAAVLLAACALSPIATLYPQEEKTTSTETLSLGKLLSVARDKETVISYGRLWGTSRTEESYDVSYESADGAIGTTTLYSTGSYNQLDETGAYGGVRIEDDARDDGSMTVERVIETTVADYSGTAFGMRVRDVSEKVLYVLHVTTSVAGSL